MIEAAVIAIGGTILLLVASILSHWINDTASTPEKRRDHR